MLRRVLAVAPLTALVLALGCASPTLPLPPPEIPTVGTGSDADHVLLTAGCGGAEGGAQIIVENYNAPGLEQIRGANATGCGSWQAEIWAHKGDSLTITQSVGAETSQSATMQVR
jgi:hypothetical protein